RVRALVLDAQQRHPVQVAGLAAPDLQQDHVEAPNGGAIGRPVGEDLLGLLAHPVDGAEQWRSLQWHVWCNVPAPNGISAARQWRPCITAWPRPRAMSHRFTGTVSTNAITRLRARLHQNSPSVRPAARAPGTSTMKALSTTSIVAIEAVSEASAIRAARRGPTPARSTGRSVSS